MTKLRPDARPAYARALASRARRDRRAASRPSVHEVVAASSGRMRCQGCAWTGDMLSSVAHVMRPE